MWNYTEEIKHWLTENPLGVIVITGPTASGKTGISIELAKEIDGEIINADSRQVYTDLPITTAAPSSEEKDGIPHHLFEYLSAENTLNVSQWRDECLVKIKEIQSRNKTVIVCGGTGLWINALTKNFSLGIAPNQELRKELWKKPIEELFAELEKKDIQQAKIIGASNKKYIIRALEICEEKGNKTDYAVEETPQFPFFFLGTTWKRETLYQRINQRNETMMKHGFLQEIQSFLEKYPHIPESDSAFIAHGVPEAMQYFSDEKTLEELQDKMKQNTRNYAKRQLTWWRKDERVRFLDMETKEEVSIKEEEY